MIMSTSSNGHTLRTCIHHIISLGLENEAMCTIIVKEGGVSVLLELCKRGDVKYIHAIALRALACVSGAPDALHRVTQCPGGVECLVRLLSGGEEVRSEAAGVLAQLTSPASVETAAGGGDCFTPYLTPLVAALTNLLSPRRRASDDVSLLAAAALANLTAALPAARAEAACAALRSAQTLPVLLARCRGDAASVYVADQIATIVSAVVSAWQTGGVHTSGETQEQCVHILLILLGSRVTAAAHSPSAATAAHSPAANSPAAAAVHERVQHKCAIALTKLASNKSNAHIIVNNGGVPRLAELCRHSQERNNSDLVLVACLAALRRISTVCGGTAQSKGDKETWTAGAGGHSDLIDSKHDHTKYGLRNNSSSSYNISLDDEGIVL